MNIGHKIRQLRERKNISQTELALELGTSQPTIFNIESGISQKIDFALMDKICNFFDVDFSYFTDNNVINNNIKQNNGQVNCENFTVTNNYPKSVLTEIQKLIDENQALKAEIARLKK
jgi:transcriptional regulator with XRE-family HTH domain